MINKYNIIGDIHGRDSWKRLVREDAINIFLGDYLDPYESEGITWDMAIENLFDILHYCVKHDETTVLLLGNHDLHYLWSANERYSRYSTEHAQRIRKIYEARLLPVAQLAYVIGDDTLVTHAGVTREWWNLLKKQLPENFPITAESVADVLNLIKRQKYDFSEALLGTAYTFLPGDNCGDSPTASPVWVRPETLVEHNVFQGTKYKQIVGHTQMTEPLTIGNITFADTLGHGTQSYMVNPQLAA